jgi:hypothetical protein
MSGPKPPMVENEIRKSAEDVVDLLRAGGAPAEVIAVARVQASLGKSVTFGRISRDHILEVYTFRTDAPGFDSSRQPGTADLLQRLSDHPAAMIRGAVISSPTNAAIIWIDDSGTKLVAAFAVRVQGGSD